MVAICQHLMHIQCNIFAGLTKYSTINLLVSLSKCADSFLIIYVLFIDRSNVNAMNIEWLNSNAHWNDIDIC